MKKGNMQDEYDVNRVHLSKMDELILLMDTSPVQEAIDEFYSTGKF